MASITADEYLCIRRAVPLAGRSVRLTLTDGSSVERDLSAVLRGGVLDRVGKHTAVFRRVRVPRGYGTVLWPGDVDLCHDVVIWGGMPPDEPGARPLPVMKVLPPRWKRARSRWLTAEGKPRSSPTWGSGPRPRDVC